MADLALRIDHQAALIELRSAVARLERGTVVTEGETISLCPPIDRLLPAGGLARGAFHEVLAADTGAATVSIGIQIWL
jgi:protein ImuA